VKTPRPRRRLKLLAAALVVLGGYPAFVLGTVYAQWFRADLPGGRNGPADAYRHALASATVAYTTSPRVVAFVTQVMERDGRGSDMRAMDAHNNRIGAHIGATAPSWREMQVRVRAAIDAGQVRATDADRITWLPRERWLDRLY
jgi:hypothetical protein